MLKKYTALMLIGLIINLVFSSFVFAQDVDARATEKIKIKIAKLGVGGKTIQVKLNDKTKTKGYITEIKEDYFVLVNKKNGASTNISYSQVNSIRMLLPKELIIAGFILAVGTLTLVIYCGSGRCEE